MHTPPAKPRSAGPLLKSFPRPCHALREALREGYRFADLRADVGAGLVVGVIALPLAMALAIATGVPPQYGIYTAIIAGATTALLGGSRVQVSGPTAAFVVVLVPIAAQYGLAGLAVATMLAGVFQIIMALSGLGRFIQFVPYPVVTGFTAGIAIVIAGLQLKDFLGLSIDVMPQHFLERMSVIIRALPTAKPTEFIIGAITLAILVFWPRVSMRIPAPLMALGSVTLGCYVLSQIFPEFSVASIRGLFATEAHPFGVPQQPPMLRWPWEFHKPGEESLQLSFDAIKDLAVAAIAIALLGAIESLLSAVVADGVTGREHDSGSELLGQGVGNVITPFFGGFAATGAIARTSANIRFGARSPIASITHALFILVAVLLLAPVLGELPMAALAALLLRVAWTMSEAPHVIRAVRVSPRSDVLVLLTCITLTVVFDMIVAVLVGVVLSALLFMKRMADIADVQLITQRHPSLDVALPENVLIYEIGGPLFFGAAQKAMSAVRTIATGVQVVVLDMRSVPVMDATGLVNLQSAMDRLTQQNIYVILAGVQHQPLEVLARARMKHHHDRFIVFSSIDEAIDHARTMAHLLIPEAQLTAAAAAPPVDG